MWYFISFATGAVSTFLILGLIGIYRSKKSSDLGTTDEEQELFDKWEKERLENALEWRKLNLEIDKKLLEMTREVLANTKGSSPPKSNLPN